MGKENTLSELFKTLEQKAPEYIKLLSAKTDDEFEEAFEAMLEKALIHLETNSKKFASLDEDALTAVLVAGLSIPGLTVTRETHSNGHVDITIEADHCSPTRRKLGEAKIYDGPSYHVSGLEQLLNRYTTGREGRGILIEYVRKKNIAGLVQGLRDKMDEDYPCQQQGKTVDHCLKWSFLSTHAHDCGENLQVSHVSCNLFVQGGKE